jgi:hypothetical protein
MKKAVLKNIEVISCGQTTIWHKCGALHRDNGPAIEKTDGTQYYYKHGLLHRDDGPAIIRPDGTNLWFKNGTLHREDGPTIIYADGSEDWLYSKVKKREKPDDAENDIDFEAAMEVIASHGFN